MIFNSKYLIGQPEAKYQRLKKLYLGGPIGRRYVDRYIQKHEGGQFYSQTLRRIYADTYDISAGIGSYGCFTTNFRPHVTIGNYCSIAPGVQRLVGNHPMTDVSTHPVFHQEAFGCCKETRYESHHLTIGNDVWIGVNAIITGNVESIGDGAVIGAGSVVTHNVEPYAIVAGSPAKLLRYRFDEEIRMALMSSRWFELTPDELTPFVELADNPLAFANAIKEFRG